MSASCALSLIRRLRRPRCVVGGVALCTILFLLCSGIASHLVHGQQDLPPLVSGASTERELAGGETHAYQIKLIAGQYINVVVEQKGIDVVVKVFGPDGKQVEEVDSPNGTQGPEEASLITAMTGIYRIEISSLEKNAKSGQYVAKLVDVRTAQPHDADRIDAHKLFAEAKRMRMHNVKESRQAAVRKFEEARNKFQAIGDRREEADVLNYLGQVWNSLGEPQKASEIYKQALVLHRTVGDRKGEIASLNNIGRAYDTLGEPQKALEHFAEALSLLQTFKDQGLEATVLNNRGLVYEGLGELARALEDYSQALPLMHTTGNRRGEVGTLNNIGAVYLSSGDPRKALEYYTRALTIIRAVDDKRGEAMVLNNVSNAYQMLGELQNSLSTIQQALPLIRAVGDRLAEATVLCNIGAIYVNLGNLQEALNHLGQGLLLHRSVGDRGGEAHALKNIGATYYSLGEPQKALVYYNLAQPILKATGNKAGESSVLNNIGNVYSETGELKKALEYQGQSLLLRQQIGDKRGEAAVLNDIGAIYSDLKEPQKALEYLQQALPLRRTAGDRIGEAITLSNIAFLYKTRGEQQTAQEYYNQALILAQDAGARREEASILKGIANLELGLGKLTEARGKIEQAISLLEFIRARAGGQENRSSFFAGIADHYALYIDVLMQMHSRDPQAGHDRMALSISEQARARSLLELLSEAGEDIGQGVAPQLLERETNFRNLITAKLDNLTKLLTGKHSKEQKADAEVEINALINQYRQVQDEIRQTSPRYAALTKPQPFSATDTQQQLLDDNTLLLEYAFGEEHSYLWAVQHNSLSTFRLPPRSEIEAATRKVYELLVARQPQAGLTEAQQQIRESEAEKNYWKEAASLSRMLLGPVANQLGDKRLLIVAPGALQSVPFAVLPEPEIEGPRDEKARGQGDEGLRNKRTGRSAAPPPRPNVGLPPLIVKHEVVNLPSASVLGVLRREFAGRQPASQSIAVLADPVFSVEDARVKTAIASGQKPMVAASDEIVASVMRRAIRSVIGDERAGLRRLLFSRDEAEAIVSLAPASSYLKALDFNASRVTVLSDQLSRYRIVHFATHGLLDSAHPELSGLALSLVDETGKQQDGYLRLNEIYNLKLNADLVVLSACQTGLGKDVRGEGLIGLTRWFMYAGAPRVVASLWQVNDAATAELMKRFYRGMLKNGLRPAAALRSAQLEMMNRPAWQSPYFWGAFVLQGEWK